MLKMRRIIKIIGVKIRGQATKITRIKVKELENFGNIIGEYY